MAGRPKKLRAVRPTEDPERIAASAREVVRAVAPELRLERRWGSPWYVGNDLVLAIGAFQRHTGVEFWRGTRLHDPGHLLEGTGKNLRHVKLRTIADATRPAFVELVRDAIRLDRTEPVRRAGAAGALPSRDAAD